MGPRHKNFALRFWRKELPSVGEQAPSARQIGYTEALFLAFVLGSIMAARREHWWLAGLLGALGWMTRAPGIVLVPTLAVEAAHQLVTTKRWRWNWLWIAVVPLGFGVYLL